MKSSEVQIRLSAYPISHENVIIFSIQNISMKNYPILRPLRNRVNYKLDLSLLKKWYSPSLELIPEKWRNSIRIKILNYLEVMNIEEENMLLEWDMEPFLDLDVTKDAHGKLTSYWQDL